LQTRDAFSYSNGSADSIPDAITDATTDMAWLEATLGEKLAGLQRVELNRKERTEPLFAALRQAAG
jgi:hypothetical protein